MGRSTFCSSSLVAILATSASAIQSDSSVILVSGGQSNYAGGPHNSIKRSVEVFDPLGTCKPSIKDLTAPTEGASGRLVGRGEEYNGRGEHTANYLPNGQLLLCGGGVKSYERISCVVLVGDTFMHHSNLTMERRKHSTVLVGDTLWIIGGYDGISAYTMETLDITGAHGNVWEPVDYERNYTRARNGRGYIGWNLEDGLKESRVKGCSVATPNNNIIMIGGVQKGEGLVEETQVVQFNPATKKWKNLAHMLGGGRVGHSCVHIPAEEGDGKILVAGGMGQAGGSEDYSTLNTAEIYDIDADQWVTVSSLNQQRAMGEMVVADGRIFFIGGAVYRQDRRDKTVLDSIEEYDPVNDIWTTLDKTLKTPRYDHAATAAPRSVVGC